jgi:hypothetical protein
LQMIGQNAVRARVFRNQYQTRSFFVEPVNQTRRTIFDGEF